MSYFLGTRELVPKSEDGQRQLATAYVAGRRVLCGCKDPSPELYIAMVNWNYIIKRMPRGGADHAMICSHYLPPEELSGLAQIQGSAITDNIEDGTTHLKLDFALSIRGKYVAPPERGEREPTEAKAPPAKMRLSSLLHYLWQEADLVKWVPKMEGKRWWGVVARALNTAVSGKQAKNALLSTRLYIPEPFRIETKAENEAQRKAHFAGLSKVDGGATPLGVLIAEYKSHAQTGIGARFTFKHIPECSFFADAELTARFERVFEAPLNLAAMVPESHPIIIATFSMAKAGYPVLHEIGMMLATKNWIPFEHMNDMALIDALTAQKRMFAKSLRFNLAPDAPIASAVLMDSAAPVALFVGAPFEAQDVTQAKRQAAETGSYDFWLWDGTEALPDLPPQKPKHITPQSETQKTLNKQAASAS